MNNQAEKHTSSESIAKFSCDELIFCVEDEKLKTKVYEQIRLIAV